jgi:hypothetical protein
LDKEKVLSCGDWLGFVAEAEVAERLRFLLFAVGGSWSSIQLEARSEEGGESAGPCLVAYVRYLCGLVWLKAHNSAVFGLEADLYLYRGFFV